MPKVSQQLSLSNKFFQTSHNSRQCHCRCQCKTKDLIEEMIFALPLSPSETLALLYFAKCYRRFASIECSLEEIKKATKIKTTSAINKLLQGLKDKGYILEQDPEPIPLGKKSRYHANHYQLTLLVEEGYHISKLEKSLKYFKKKLSTLKKEKAQVRILDTLDHKQEQLQKHRDNHQEAKDLIVIWQKKIDCKISEPQKKKTFEPELPKPQDPESTKTKPAPSLNPLSPKRTEEEYQLIENNMQNHILFQAQEDKDRFSEQLSLEIKKGRNQIDIIKGITSNEKFFSFIKDLQPTEDKVVRFTI